MSKDYSCAISLFCLGISLDLARSRFVAMAHGRLLIMYSIGERQVSESLVAQSSLDLGDDTRHQWGTLV